MDTGPKIKGYLKEKGLTQTFLCQHTGLSHCTMSNKLAGKREFKADEYVKVCKALGVPLDYFYEERG